MELMDTDTMTGFMRAQAAGDSFKVLDVKRALEYCKPGNVVEIGLAEDWGWTSGTVYEGDSFVEDPYFFAGSNWATPVVVVNGEVIECWKLSEEPNDCLDDWFLAVSEKEMGGDCQCKF